MFEFLFLIAGGAALGMGYVLHQQGRYFQQDILHVQGRIVAIRETASAVARSARNVHQPLIEYVFQGQTWQHVAAYDVRLHHQQVGAAVLISFHPQRPNLVCTAHDLRAKKLLKFICFGLGIPFTALGLYLCIDTFQNFQTVFTFDMFLGLMGMLILGTLLWRMKPIFVLYQAQRKNAIWGMLDNAEAVHPARPSITPPT